MTDVQVALIVCSFTEPTIDSYLFNGVGGGHLLIRFRLHYLQQLAVQIEVVLRIDIRDVTREIDGSCVSQRG